MGKDQAGQAWGTADTGGLPLQGQVPAEGVGVSVHSAGQSPGSPGSTAGHPRTPTPMVRGNPLRDGTGDPQTLLGGLEGRRDAARGGGGAGNGGTERSRERGEWK